MYCHCYCSCYCLRVPTPGGDVIYPCPNPTLWKNPLADATTIPIDMYLNCCPGSGKWHFRPFVTLSLFAPWIYCPLIG